MLKKLLIFSFCNMLLFTFFISNFTANAMYVIDDSTLIGGIVSIEEELEDSNTNVSFQLDSAIDLIEDGLI